MTRVRTNFVARKQKRQKEAKERQEQRDKLTNAQQVERLNKRLGKGVGATKERKKLSGTNNQEQKANSKKDKKNAKKRRQAKKQSME